MASTERFSMMMYPHAAGKDGKPQVHETEAVDLAALLGVLERRGRRVALQGQPEVDFGLFKAKILEARVGEDLPTRDGALDLGGQTIRVRLLPISNTGGYDTLTVQLGGQSRTLHMNQPQLLELKVPKGITL